MMDLADADAACASVADAKGLLERAKTLIKTIDEPNNHAWCPDKCLFDLASDTFYSAQPPGIIPRGIIITMPRGIMSRAIMPRPPAFPQLLAAFEAAVAQVATPAQKTKKQDYCGTDFLGHMSQHQRRALKLALGTDVELIIATARRNATDAVPKLFDGAPLNHSTS